MKPIDWRSTFVLVKDKLPDYVPISTIRARVQYLEEQLGIERGRYFSIERVLGTATEYTKQNRFKRHLHYRYKVKK
jgi:hypothetical protein